MTSKLVQNIDNETWRKFVGTCKIKNVKVGVELSKVLRKYVNNGGRI